MPAEIQRPSDKPSYFLISVSTRENLDLCTKYGLAGFPSGESGAWTYCEIQEGDFVSFLHGAKAHNLYQVREKEALKSADSLPPWKPLFFEESGTTYSFPFRLHLQLNRKFIEPVVRTEFFYVAENLLLRGGYRKTHFQADQTTLQSVSEMGFVSRDPLETLILPDHNTFSLRFTRSKELISKPETFRFRETILQSAIRRHLTSETNLQAMLTQLELTNVGASELEILGEKPLPQGHIDLLLKQRVPLGSSLKIPMEVKTDKGQTEDLAQLRAYMDELQGECPGGVLIAFDFSKQTVAKAPEAGIRLIRYALGADLKTAVTFDEIQKSLSLTRM
jgi:hypothetical protein